MEATADAQPICYSIADLICFLFLHPLLNWATRIQKLCSSSHVPLLRSTSSAASQQQKSSAARTNQEHLKGEEMTWGVRAEEVEMVMRSMGLMEEHEGGSGRLEDLVTGGGDVRCMFEEEEPSVEEVQEAFLVFDRNRDGFVDAEELGSALCMLGFNEGASVEKCRRMIRAFDGNGDGRIDFLEFVKLMESSLC